MSHYETKNLIELATKIVDLTLDGGASFIDAKIRVLEAECRVSFEKQIRWMPQLLKAYQEKGRAEKPTDDIDRCKTVCTWCKQQCFLHRHSYEDCSFFNPCTRNSSHA